MSNSKEEETFLKDILKKANCPFIISASRATDIPAFYSEKFIATLKKGFTERINPFNKKKYYISFERTRVFVFWSKNPKPLIPYLKELDNKNFNYYFQFTLNDYDKENFEPNVPVLKKRISVCVCYSKFA